MKGQYIINSDQDFWKVEEPFRRLNSGIFSEIFEVVFAWPEKHVMYVLCKFIYTYIMYIMYCIYIITKITYIYIYP